MMARRPDALAARRERDHVDVKAVVMGGGCSKPKEISENPGMSEIWDATVGDGAAYKEEDSPLLTQLVYDFFMIDECHRNLIGEDGRPQLFLTVEDEDGFQRKIQNPYRKELKDLTQEALKLASEFGLTPMARARLGLTTASANAVNVSIADQIRKAMGTGR